MKTYKIFATLSLLLIFYSSYATPVPTQLTDTDVKKILSTLNFLCSGHVTGAPNKGSPGPHINWKAYSSNLTPKAFVSKYTKQLGLPLNEAEKDCSTWNYKDGKSDSIFEVCNIQSSGPWISCKKPLFKSKSIIMSSSITR